MTTPTAWIGPQGQLMQHEIFEAWKTRDPERAATFEPLFRGPKMTASVHYESTFEFDHFEFSPGRVAFFKEGKWLYKQEWPPGGTLTITGIRGRLSGGASFTRLQLAPGLAVFFDGSVTVLSEPFTPLMTLSVPVHGGLLTMRAVTT